MKEYLLLIIVLMIYNSSFANERISNLVIPVSYFVDHVKQLDDIKNNLNKYRQASIVGTSGIGKTQLARTYAYENQNQYSLIWFFDCNLDINHEFVKLAKQLNQTVNAGLSEEPKQSQKAVLDYLTHKDKWLLIFDNLKIGDNKKVKDLVEWEHNGHVIFASQEKGIIPHVIQLKNFNKNDCITLANSILENSSHDIADFLATSFNGYPILIVQTAQLLNQVKGLDLEMYKKKALQATDKIKLNLSLAINELTPTAVNLLYQIALINNQSFSKDFLTYITSSKKSLDDDIYKISKFALISNTIHSETNPIFEMHDVIAQTLIAMIEDKKVKGILEELIDNLILAVPKDIADFHVFRSGKTIFENFKVLSKYTERYNIDLLKSMGLKLYLMTQYNNYSDYYGAERLVLWFNKNDNAQKFKPLFMSNDEKARYADFLQSIARYYRNRDADFNKSMQYIMKAKEVYEGVKGYEDIKGDLYYQLVMNELKIGNISSVNEYIEKLKNTNFNNNIESMLFYLQGKYELALERIDAATKIRLNKIKSNDLVLTANYLLRAQILNCLGEYQKAYFQAEQLYNMHKPNKKEDHLIFGRIYIQMAKSELGLGNINKAYDYITKAIAIFLADEKRNSKSNDISKDLDLAAGYVVQGDIFNTQNDLKRAIESYKKAQVIYFYLYRDRSKNIAHVSYLYMQGAKTSCKAKDLYNYNKFGKPQVREFGVNHPNTVDMFKYCEQYNMDLWTKKN